MEKERIAAFAATDKAAANQFVARLHEAGLLTIPAGNQIVRRLPALNLTRAEAEQGMQIIESVVVPCLRADSQLCGNSSSFSSVTPTSQLV